MAFMAVEWVELLCFENMPTSRQYIYILNIIYIDITQLPIIEKSVLQIIKHKKWILHCHSLAPLIWSCKVGANIIPFFWEFYPILIYFSKAKALPSNMYRPFAGAYIKEFVIYELDRHIMNLRQATESDSIAIVASNQWRLKPKPRHVMITYLHKCHPSICTFTFQWRVPTQVGFHTRTHICSTSNSATHKLRLATAALCTKQHSHIHTRKFGGGGSWDQNPPKQPRKFSSKNAPQCQNISASDQLCTGRNALRLGTPTSKTLNSYHWFLCSCCLMSWNSDFSCQGIFPSMGISRWRIKD